QGRVIPGVAGGAAAASVGPRGVNLLQLRVDATGLPAESEWQVSDVQAQIVHHASLAAELVLPLPIDGFVRVEIAGMEKGRPRFQDSTEAAAFRQSESSVGCGKEWKFRRDADEALELRRYVANAARGCEVDAKGL